MPPSLSGANKPATWSQVGLDGLLQVLDENLVLTFRFKFQARETFNLKLNVNFLGSIQVVSVHE